MARRRRSFFFDNISKRLLTNTTKNTKQSQDDANSNASANTDFMKQADVNRLIGTKSINALTDVVITNVANTEILQYDGTNWVNATQVSGFSGAYADLTGKPTIPTNNNQLTNGAGFATTSYVDAEVAGVVNSAPATLDTLNELAAALGDDANFATTTSTSLGNRLRIDVSNQSLTGTQKTNALTNLGITATVAELNYTDGVTSNIQTQLDAKGTSSFSGAYADLTGKPSLFSGSYNDLSNKPTIPTNNNELTNGAGYITSSALSSYATSTDLTDGTITKINNQATVGDSIEFFQNDGGGNLGIRFNANYNTSVEDGSAWEFQFNNDSTSGDFLIYYDGSISAADEAITWVEGLRLDGGDSQLYVFGDKVWDAGNLTNLNQLTNGPGYITGITSSMVTTALGYTPGTSSFSGSYNDLSNKPTIPTNNNQLTNGAGYITSTSASTLTVSGSITGNDLRTNRYLYAATDTNTYIDMQLAADTIRVVCGGNEVFRVGVNYMEFQDSDTLRLGAGSDFRMWHDGTNHYFRNYNHGGGNIYWQGENSDGTNHALLYMYTSVSRSYLSFYENSSERMRTTSAGVTTYGAHNATGNICAYSSDARLKTNVVNIENALEKLMSLNGVTFDWKEEVKDLGFNPTLMYNEAGVLAQEVEAVLPQATAPAPFDTDYDTNTGERISKSGKNYLTVQYEKIVPLLIEAMKEQQQQIEDLKEIINGTSK